MDLRMPRVDGVEATRRIRAEHPGTRVVVLTTYADDESIVGALRAGAIGYITKDAGRDHIGRALEAAASGQAVLDPAVQARLVDVAALPRTGAAGWPPSGRVDRAGGRGPPSDRRGALEFRDREGPLRERGHRQDPCESHLREDGQQGPVPGGRLRASSWSRRLMELQDVGSPAHEALGHPERTRTDDEPRRSAATHLNRHRRAGDVISGVLIKRQRRCLRLTCLQCESLNHRSFSIAPAEQIASRR